MLTVISIKSILLFTFLFFLRARAQNTTFVPYQAAGADNVTESDDTTPASTFAPYQVPDVDNAAESNVDGILFGKIHLQLSSQSSSTANDLLFQLLSQTRKFLDNTLAADYQQQNNYTFYHVNLAVNNFEMEPSNITGETLYNAKIDLEGTALFIKSPSGYNIDTNVGDKIQIAFQDQTAYLQLLKATKNTFLKNLTFSLISFSPSEEHQHSSSNKESSQIMPTWAVAVLSAGCAIILLILLGLLYICLCKSRSSVPRPIPKPSIQITASNTSSSKKTRCVDEESSDKSRTPSPIHSITSQESSIFTYNPGSKGSGAGSSFFGSSFQANNTHIELDLEAWQKGSTINSGQNVPFGHDISAIESKRDLSLIEEVDEKTLMTPEQTRCHSLSLSLATSPAPSLSATAGQNPRSLLSESNLRDLNQRATNAHEVIQDLNDLCEQIDTHRSHTKRTSHDNYLDYSTNHQRYKMDSV